MKANIRELLVSCSIFLARYKQGSDRRDAVLQKPPHYISKLGDNKAGLPYKMVVGILGNLHPLKCLSIEEKAPFITFQ